MPEMRIAPERSLTAGRAAGPESVQLRRTAPAAAAALDLIAHAGPQYGFRGAPVSLNPRLSGNRNPGSTRLEWLAGQNKCNQFVGDVLFLSGWRMPAVKMPDGSEHYAIAEELPRRTRFFDPAAGASEIRAGDVLVIDYLSASGPSTAHAEIITAWDPACGSLETAGAHREGAYSKIRQGFFSNLRYDPAARLWRSLTERVYVLRPKLPL